MLEPSELYLDDETPNPDSLKVRKGYAEAAFSLLGTGDIVQFPRYGFVRVDGPGRVHTGSPLAPTDPGCDATSRLILKYPPKRAGLGDFVR